MKSFKPHSWMLPQPVLIIGTYDITIGAMIRHADIADSPQVII